MMIHESTDVVESWTEAYLLTNDPAAYSDLSQIADNEIGVLYETGKEWPFETITWDIVEFE